MDTRTEKAIQDAMRLVMKNRTSIIIAHRLSTIRDAVLIVVMDQEQLAEWLGKCRYSRHHRDRPDPAHYPAPP